MREHIGGITVVETFNVEEAPKKQGAIGVV